MDGVTFILELDGTETRLPDVAAVGVLLARLASVEEAELWVFLDRGPRSRTWLGRILGTPAHEIEPYFWLGKAGGVATLTFLDGAWSEYRATDPGGPVPATGNQRAALSRGEPTMVPLELCLRADLAIAAAVHYLAKRERPDWLAYQYVP